MIIELIGLILTGLSSVYLIPQIKKTFKSKKVRDISQTFVIYNFVIHGLWTIYNVYRVIQDSSITPYLVNSSIRTLSAFIFMIMFLKYKR